MNRISNIKVISIDLFRTLVDIKDSDELIYKLFLMGKYSDAISMKYWERARAILNKKWNDAGINNISFKNVRMILEETLTDFFHEIGLNHDPRFAANILIDEHKKHSLFEDAIPFLKTVGGQYRICLSTDCDIDMLPNVNEVYSFDHIFVSEKLKVYKLNSEFFNQLIEHYKLKPENIMHIGDSTSDIVAPKDLGLLTCWLNRKNRKLNHTTKPDFEVKSLMEIVPILRLAK